MSAQEFINTYAVRPFEKTPLGIFSMDLSRTDCKDVCIASIGGIIGALAAGLAIVPSIVVSVLCAAGMLMVKLLAKPSL